MGDFKTLLIPMVQSAVRYGLVAVAGWAGTSASSDDIDNAAKVIGGICVAVAVLVWSYFNKRAVLHTTPGSTT